jgi:hypothetical protein
VCGFRRADTVTLTEQKSRQKRADAAVVVDYQQMRSIVGRIGGWRRHET